MAAGTRLVDSLPVYVFWSPAILVSVSFQLGNEYHSRKCVVINIRYITSCNVSVNTSRSNETG